LGESGVATALFDGFPISEGHALVVPKRHVASFFDLSLEEQSAVWVMVAQVGAELSSRFCVKDLNIGLNDGPAAGQTVAHAHIHVIPRRPGDVPDPRGGVRWVIAEKAAYWEAK
jgi:diadenosine tetraphosphate (Ap4A) HIT family hydrolase